MTGFMDVPRVLGDDLRLQMSLTECPDQTIEALERFTAPLMLQKMGEWKGVGLAANQCGFGYRIFAYDDQEGHRGWIVNPVQDDASGTEEAQEGCLSLPGILETKRRAAEVVVKGIYQGEETTWHASGLLARIFQHEIDHLNGILITG